MTIIFKSYRTILNGNRSFRKRKDALGKKSTVCDFYFAPHSSRGRVRDVQFKFYTFYFLLFYSRLL